MKYVALILSFMLFNQSLTVCAPSVFKSASSAKEATCISHESYGQNSSSTSCCKKKKESSEHQSHDNGCCDDGCKCLCCVKVFVHQLTENDQKELDNTIFVDRIIAPVLFKTFDFHQTLIAPPKKK